MSLNNRPLLYESWILNSYCCGNDWFSNRIKAHPEVTTRTMKRSPAPVAENIGTGCPSDTTEPPTTTSRSSPPTRRTESMSVLFTFLLGLSGFGGEPLLQQMPAIEIIAMP